MADLAPAAAARHAPAPGDVAVRVEADLDFHGPQYAALYAASAATVFQHPLWLDLLYRRVAPALEASPLVVTGRGRDDGELRFVLPLIVRSRNGIRLLEAADLGVGDYAAPVVARRWNPPKGLARAVRNALPPHDVLRIDKIRDEAAARWRALLGGEASRAPFSTHAVAVSAPYSEWRDGALGKSFAKYLDRRKKRFIKSGAATLKHLENEAAIREAIAAMAALRAGRFGNDPIQYEPVKRFYADLAVAGARAGLARTYSLLQDGETVGHLFGLTSGGCFHYLLIGCDYERFGRHSPGLLLYDLIIEDWIAAGGTAFDFTIGDEPFKRDFGTIATPMHRIAVPATALGRLALFALEARTRLRGNAGGAPA